MEQFEKGIAVDTAKTVIRWYISQQPKPAGKPKLIESYNEASESVCRDYTTLVSTFNSGIKKGWQQAMEQKPASPAPSPANGWGPLISDDWVVSLAGNIIDHNNNSMVFDEVKTIIQEHIAKHGLPVQNIEVSPKVVEQPVLLANANAVGSERPAIDWEQRWWDAAMAAATGYASLSWSGKNVAIQAKAFADDIVAAMKEKKP